MSQLPFKQYARGTRIQATDLIYNGGMYYSFKPLVTGYARRLINYDLVDSGGALKARPGLKKKDKVLLEQIPNSGELILQKGSGEALFEYTPAQTWLANSVAALGDTLEIAVRSKYSDAYQAVLSPGHLFLIGNPSLDHPENIIFSNSTSCFQLGDLFHVSPFYSAVSMQKKEERGEEISPQKNYFQLGRDTLLEYTMLPSDPPDMKIIVDKAAQEIRLDGITDHDLLLQIGYWDVFPGDDNGLISVYASGDYPDTFKWYWGTHDSWWPYREDMNNSVELHSYLDNVVLLVIPKNEEFKNVVVRVQVEAGLIPTTWEPHIYPSITTPVVYQNINGVPFKDSYWMQYSPCCFGFDGRFIYLSNTIFDNSGDPQIQGFLMSSAGGRGTSPSDVWSFAQDKITPKELNPSEASMWGYNMLLENPYTFANGTTGTVITLTGILPYTADGTQIELNPRVNQTIMLECFYSAQTPANYTIKFEWKDVVSASWTTIATVSPNASNKFRCTFNNPGREIYIRATAIKSNTEEAVIASGFNFSPTAQLDKFENYNLPTCKHMLYANRRLCLYGLPKDESLIFFSDYNDPGYFPYPQNMLQFDSSVKKVIEYQQNWLVFTTHSVYIVTLQADGLTWEQSLIQTGLEITDINALFIAAVRSFVIFKSGNYVYLVVPSSSVAGTLTVAPIYLPIKELLDDLNSFFKETLYDTFSYSEEYALRRFQVYTTLDEIHLVFSMTLNDGEWANIDLIYNTLNRVWRTYCFATAGMFLPFVEDITQGSQLLTTPPDNVSKICSYQFETMPTDITDETSTKYGNVQLLDTGYRDITVELKKRFREFQYTIYMENIDILKFSTKFYIDGFLRKQSTAMQGELTPDPEQEGRYLLQITDEPIYDFLPNILAPENPLIPEGYWQLDVSDFTTLQTLKVRQSVSGKGYAPRLVLKANNTATHELLHNAWVYRTLYSR